MLENRRVFQKLTIQFWGCTIFDTEKGEKRGLEEDSLFAWIVCPSLEWCSRLVESWNPKGLLQFLDVLRSSYVG
jgi:hypothetical protein